MKDCPKCGFPLTKGNIKIVRPRGKKRPYRIHRRCPEPKPVVFAPGFTSEDFNQQVQTPFPGGDTAGTPVQRPQDTTGGPFTAEVVFQGYEPPRYRYFMTPDQAERVKRALEKQMAGFGVGFEVIPVPEDQVEADPKSFAGLVEVTVDWKVE